MNSRFLTVIFGALVAGTVLSTAAIAQDQPYDPGHPRVNEVDQRLTNQQNRVNQGLAHGTMTQGQAKRDERRDARIQRQEQRQAARHGGHLTKREQRHDNHELNHNSKHIYNQKH